MKILNDTGTFPGQILLNLPVWRGRVEDKVGEEADEEEVEDELAVVDVAPEAVPLVPHERHAQRVAQQLSPLLAHHDHDLQIDETSP